MITTYVQKKTTIQKIADSKAASVLDASLQSESLQRKADIANNAAQRAEAPRPNNTGMPDNLKSGIESLSGFSMDEVRVHYNSSKPATVQALAYTQGTDIHVAPGQEKHLPHEAWHVAQQMAGRVSPTTNINGMPVNDNAGLEHEADVMGEKAVAQRVKSNFHVFWKETRPSDPHILDDAERAGKRKADRRGARCLIIRLDSPSFKRDKVGEFEDVHIVSHGERPSIKYHNMFANMSASNLALTMVHVLPPNYSGCIYLDGCHTAVPRRMLNDGTSFAERFGNALLKSLQDKGRTCSKCFSVKGNLGSASTAMNGRIMVKERRYNRQFLRQNLIGLDPSRNYKPLLIRGYRRYLGKTGKRTYSFSLKA